jgi:hypothetical protein
MAASPPSCWITCRATSGDSKYTFTSLSHSRATIISITIKRKLEREGK